VKIGLKRFSYRFAEQVQNSRLALKQEIEDILGHIDEQLPSLSRPQFNLVLREKFVQRGWEDQPVVFNEAGDPSARMGFMK